MKKTFQILFQSIIIFICISGIYIDIRYQHSVKDGLNMLAYFTIQSNFFVAVALMGDIAYTLKGKEQSSWFVIFRSGATLCIILTGLVYHILLSPIHHAVGVFIYPNVGLHYIAPIGMFLDWLLFEKKGQYRYRYALVWLVYPTLYALGSMLRGSIDGFFPYWFVNPWGQYPYGTGGLLPMLELYVGISLIFYLLGMLMIITDKLIAGFHLQPLQEVEQDKSLLE